MSSADTLASIGGVYSTLVGDPRVGVSDGVISGDVSWRWGRLPRSKNDENEWAGLGSSVDLGVNPLLLGRKKGSGCLEVPSRGSSKVL